MTAPAGVTVHGAATAEELAAVLAVLAGAVAEPAPTRYEQWQAARRRALRTEPDGMEMPGRRTGRRRWGTIAG